MLVKIIKGIKAIKLNSIDIQIANQELHDIVKIGDINKQGIM